MKKYIIANWKMNPLTMVEAKRNVAIIEQGIKKVKNVETVICAPFIFLSGLKATNNLKIGAQNCFWEDKGPFTGEVSPGQLKDSGAEYVILGHSERRKYLGEKTEDVNLKIKASLKSGLKVVFCIGSETEKPGKEMKDQIIKGLKGVEKEDALKIIFVYEPIWAISTTKNKVVATPKQALNGGLYMRKVLNNLFDEKTAKTAVIIYGGSVNSKNIGGFLKEGNMAGGLVGAASLDPEEFVRTIKEANC